jgi:DNA-binding MarR family transcriptional regulator
MRDPIHVSTTRPIVTLPCLCASLRRTTRAITHLYEEALRPLGLRATQFTILQALERTGEITQGELGELLAIDSTTLTRTLHIMRRNGWVAERPGDDRRERWLALAKAGHAQLVRATPAWEKTQSMLQKKLGDGPWHTLFTLTSELTSLAQSQGDLS